MSNSYSAERPTRKGDAPEEPPAAFDNSAKPTAAGFARNTLYTFFCGSIISYSILVCAPGRSTHQEGVADDPGGVTVAARNVGTLRKIEDTADTLRRRDAAQVHVRRADGPRLAAERE